MQSQKDPVDDISPLVSNCKMAWSSKTNNMVQIYDVQSNSCYPEFQGGEISSGKTCITNSSTFIPHTYRYWNSHYRSFWNSSN